MHEGLVDRLIPSSGETSGGATVFAKRGVKALLRAIGIESREGVPNAADDINYVSRERSVENAAELSTIAFEEGQLSASPTSAELRTTEDPSPVEHSLNPRADAYERDARSIRAR
jgi:hypothetical protein